MLIFGKDIKLFIMTFHKLVKKIYEECLRSHCASNIATEEEIQKCMDIYEPYSIQIYQGKLEGVPQEAIDAYNKSKKMGLGEQGQ